MPFAYRFEPKDGYLLVKTMGSTDNVGDLLQYAANIASEVARTGTERVLVDESEAAVRLKFHEMLLNVKAFFEVSSQRPLVKRTAIVCRKHSFCLYSYLVEKVSTMVTSKLKLFTDHQAAEEWLRSN